MKPLCTCGQCKPCRRRQASRKSYAKLHKLSDEEKEARKKARAEAARSFRESPEGKAREKEYQLRYQRSEKGQAKRRAAQLLRRSNPAHREKMNERARKKRAESDTGAIYSQKRRKLNPEKAAIYDQVRKALRRGEIVRPDACSWCGEDRKVDAHHPDYSKPLHIVWLCRSCHKRLHATP